LPKSSTGYLTPIPLGGPFNTAFKLSVQPVEVLFVALPALIVSAVLLRNKLAEHEGRLEYLCLLANVLLIITFSSSYLWVAYTAMGRASIGIVLAAVLCGPYVRLRPLRDRSMMELATAGVLWMAMLPAVLVYGFFNIAR